MGRDSSTWDFRSMFLASLRAALDVPTLPIPFVEAFDAALAARTSSALPGVHARHVETSSLFAAAYDALVALGDPDPLARLGRVIDAYGAQITVHMRAVLDASPDPFDTIVAESKTRETDYFGDDFAFERPLDDARAYHLHITDCAYARLFANWRLPQLTGLFCRLDEAWIRSINPPRHGVAFARPATIGWGGSRCLFLFERTSGERNATPKKRSPDA